jgi:aspartyl-tRNA(Asn)/glutamyl-tRNA(Gln) amidotransferase subunit A
MTADAAEPDLSIVGLAEAIRTGATTASEVTRRTLERIAALDTALRAFVAVDGDRALARADSLDAEVRAGRIRSVLHGVPVAYKDLCFIRGLPNACGTGRAEYFTAVHDCDIARRLSRAGAISIGKLAMTPLAMGSFGVTEGDGGPVNPWAPDRIPGGSSSGCGVAVAAGLVMVAVGTDTGGSIRIPAVCCGVAGLKPTYDRVSRAGIMPVSPSLDHVGPLALRVADLARLFPFMVRASRASRAAQVAPPATNGDLRGLRVGVAEGDYFADVTEEVAGTLAGAVSLLRDLGATVRPLTLRDPRPLMAATATIVRAEAAAAHGHLLDEPSSALSPLVRARLEEGRRVTATAYLHAIHECAGRRRTFLQDVFAGVDVVLGPTTPEPPPPRADVMGPPGRVAERMAHWAKFARFFNGLGIPVLALPTGLTREGVPLGVQVAGPPFGEPVLFVLGAALEAAAGWPRHPRNLAPGAAARVA